ncbi:hypothetical protein GCM10020331_097270 [Ectobacillus funiculus]
MGREPVYGKTGWVNKKNDNRYRKSCLNPCKSISILARKMRELSVANMQMVEIATAISYNADLIIMDEPTSAITDKEVDHLFRIIDSLVKKRSLNYLYLSQKWMKYLRSVMILPYFVMDSM